MGRTSIGWRVSTCTGAASSTSRDDSSSLRASRLPGRSLCSRVSSEIPTCCATQRSLEVLSSCFSEPVASLALLETRMIKFYEHSFSGGISIIAGGPVDTRLTPFMLQASPRTGGYIAVAHNLGPHLRRTLWRATIAGLISRQHLAHCASTPSMCGT